MKRLVTCVLVSLLLLPTLTHAQHRSGGMHSIIAASGPRGVEIAALHSGSVSLAMPVILGGFTAGESVSSLGMPNPYTPTVSPWRLVGDLFIGAGSVPDVEVHSHRRMIIRSGVGDANGGNLYLDSHLPDAATATSVFIRARPDLTTAGAKILSVGDNAGGTYAEKLSVSHNGVLWPESATPNRVIYGSYMGSTVSDYGFGGDASGAPKVFAQGGGQVWTASTSTISSSLVVTGGLTAAYAAKTAAYTVTDADYTLTGDPSGASFTFTLPAAAGRTGKLFTFKKLTATANTITIDGNAAETIDGAATLVIGTQDTVRTIQSDGANWIVVGGLGAL